MVKMDTNTEELVMGIIIHAGNARAESYDALNKAKENNYEEAENHLKKAEDEIKQAHVFQTNLLQSEAQSVENITPSLLVIHAMDHLMTAMSEKTLIEEIFHLYKKIEGKNVSS